MLDGLLKIKKEEGLQALWSGTLPSLILVSNPAIQFMIYEAVKRQLHIIYPEKKLGATVFFFVGALSKAVATVLTYPLQLLQTKLRVSIAMQVMFQQECDLSFYFSMDTATATSLVT